MKCIFSKVTRLRVPEYQLMTKIFVSGNGEKFIEKKAISKESFHCIERIKNTYPIYRQSIINPKITIAELKETSQDTLRFSYIHGDNLDNKLCGFLLANDYKAFNDLIKKYHTFLNSSFDCLDNFESSEGFLSFFGKSITTERIKPLRSYKVSNLDLNLDNIVFDAQSGFFRIYDLDWIFNFSVPINYIFWRSLSNFYKIRHPDLLSIEELNQMFWSFHITENEIRTYIEMDEGFYNTTHKNHTKYLKNYSKKEIKLPESKYRNNAAKKNSIRKISLKLKNLASYPFKSLSRLFHYCLEDNRYSFHPHILDNKVINEILSLQYKPLISIIMPVYNTNVEFLRSAVESVEKQWYKNWELCISDDASTNQNTLDYLKSIQDNSKIKIKFLDKNLHISGASNEALNMATGDYIALLDHDDELTSNALYEVVKVINTTDAKFIYSDEDAIIENVFCKPHFKPDYSHDMLLSHNYICHFAVIEKLLIDKVIGFSEGVDGAQDYDLFLKVLENTNKVFHIPEVLYHWRRHLNSISCCKNAKSILQESGKTALSRAITRRNLDATVEKGNKYAFMYRVKYKIIDAPLISIIIPFRDKPELLKKCINSILNKSSYTNFELIGINNSSTDKKTFQLMEYFSNKDPRLHFIDLNIPFNYSKLNNYAVTKFSKGEHILLLNNDTEIISEDWIESLLEHSQREEIGAVGGLLIYPNNRIQHAGVIIGLEGVSAHPHNKQPISKRGYQGRPHHIQNLSAVTGACLMVKKKQYLEIGGLDEENLAITCNDIDFCLRLREKGYRNIYTPYCKLYHYESASRGSKLKEQRRYEKDYMRKRHAEILKNGDPYYNPNLSLKKPGFTL